VIVYSATAPGIADAGPARTAFVATLSANVTVADVDTTVFGAASSVALIV